MGTRNLTMVIANGKTKVAQYGQWDGYPSGQGVTALNFLRNTDLGKFKERLQSVRFFNKKDEKARKDFLTLLGSNDGWVTMEQSAKYDKKFPFDSRDHGAEILQMLMDSEGEVALSDHSSFAADSLFCEWAYVIDFDKGTFEVYRGFNTESLKETDRFAYMEGAEKSGTTYYPVRLLKEYTLSKLPTKEQFLQECEKEEEVEEG